MNWLHLQSPASWVLRTSIEASLIALLIWAAQSLLRNRVSARWRYNLWLLVVLRLVLPAFPQSRLSPFNWMSVGKVAAGDSIRTTKLTSPARPLPMPKAQPMHNGDADPPLVADLGKSTQDEQLVASNEVVQQPKIRMLDSLSDFSTVKSDGWHGQVLLPVVVAQQNHGQEYLPVPPKTALPESKNITLVSNTSISRWISYAGAIWIFGCILLLLRSIVLMWRLRGSVSRLPSLDDLPVAALYSECCRQMHISRRPALLEAPSDFAPALVGVLRPKLLLSKWVVRALAPNELRLVLLHELVHLKRRDVAMNSLLSLLLCLHWFNPLLWWAFAKMRADRELACDEAVLALGQTSRRHDDRRDYGSAMIKLLETFATRAVAPAAAVGVLDASPTMRGAQMRRRISMIAQFNKPKGWSLAGMTLSAALAAVALTGAVSGQQQAPAPGVDPAAPGGVPQQRQMSGMPGAGPAIRPGMGGMPGMMGQNAQVAPANPAAQPSPGEGGGIGGSVRVTPGGAYGGGEMGGFAAPPGAAPGGGIGAAPGGTPGPGGPTPPPATAEPVPLFSGMVEGPEAARADAKSLEKLRKPIPVSIDNLALREAMNYLADQTGIDVFVDSKALEQAGVAVDSPVRLQIRQPLPGDEVLRLMLRSAAGDELGYGILHGVVYVTTREQLEMSRVTRAYDVSDFENQEDQLQRAVMRTIAPGSWDNNGGSGSVLVLGHKMIVTAAEPNQREIAKLLELLRDNEPAKRTQNTPGPRSDAGADHKIFRLRFADAQTAANQVAAILGKQNLSEKEVGWELVPDPRTNSVLVVASGPQMARIQSLLSELDNQQQDKPAQKPAAPGGKNGAGPSASATLHIPQGQSIEVPADMQDELRQLWDSKYQNKIIQVDGKDWNHQEIEKEFREEALQRIIAHAARQAADGSAQKASQ